MRFMSKLRFQGSTVGDGCGRVWCMCHALSILGAGKLIETPTQSLHPSLLRSHLAATLGAMASAALSREERYRITEDHKECKDAVSKDCKEGVNSAKGKRGCCIGNPRTGRIECSELSAAALSQVVAQAKTTANFAR